jgi:SAM-dependent methyltransferase
MSNQERTRWDERFGSRDRHAASDPDPFLTRLDRYADLFPPGRRAQGRQAIDIACGAGRNAVWLAEHGWSVTGCDFSLEGLRRAQALARERRVALSLFCQDLETIELPLERFDLVVCFFYLQRSLFPMLKRALRRGGLIVYKTYTTAQIQFAGGPRHPMHLLEPGELRAAFADFEEIDYEEITIGRGVEQLIARKR